MTNRFEVHAKCAVRAAILDREFHCNGCGLVAERGLPQAVERRRRTTMRIFKRVSQSVTVGVGTLLDSLENQEAVARATIREVELGAGRVRVRRQAIERELG